MMSWWWTDDEHKMNWWWTDVELMINWWWTDYELMMNWWWANDELMMSWWWTGDELMMNWWCTSDELMMDWWWTEWFRAVWNNQTEMLDWIGLGWVGIGISLNRLTTRSPYGDKNQFFGKIETPVSSINIFSRIRHIRTTTKCKYN